MTVPHLLDLALSAANTLKYPLIMAGAFIEGPVVMITAGFLARHGALLWVPLFVSLFAGDLIGDLLWYTVGRYGAEPLIRKKGRFLGVTERTFEKMKSLFIDHHTNILLISKLTLGFGAAKGVLMAAGASKVPLGRFILLNTIGEIVLVTVLLALGYFFGDVYSDIAHRYRAYFVAGIILIIVTLIIVVTRKMKQRFAE
jgi:membrane protein DedA with SNARE-associated domain